MKLKVFGVIDVEGEPLELAMYSHSLLEIFKMKAEFDAQQNKGSELDLIKRFNLEDLMKSEMFDDAKQNNKDNNVTGGETQ